MVDEYKNLKDELNVLTHKFTYHHSKQDDNLNSLTEDLRKNNRKIEQQQQINQEKNNLLSNEIKNLKNEIDVYLTEKIKCINLKQIQKINLLEENVEKISNKVDHQKQIIENNKNQCIRFNSFLNNYSIKSITISSNLNFRLNDDNITIDINKISNYGHIECNIFRTLYAMKIQFNIKYDESRMKIMTNLSQLTYRNIITNINVIQDKNCSGDGNIRSDSIPLYMLCLLFGTKIITFDGEDVTDLFENNFNSVKIYHERYYYCMKENEYCHNKVIESKRMLDMCDVDVVRELFR